MNRPREIIKALQLCQPFAGEKLSEQQPRAVAFDLGLKLLCGVQQSRPSTK